MSVKSKAHVNGREQKRENMENDKDFGQLERGSSPERVETFGPAVAQI
jgi:hypothetical protein